MAGVYGLQKSQPVRSKRLRDSARGQPCTVRLPGCTGGGDDSVLAHMPGCGRGVGTKTSDINALIACSRCHDAIDRRTRPVLSSEANLAAIIRGHAETVQHWIDIGLISVAGNSNG